MNNAYSALLTELGIIITEDGNVKRSFPFDNPVSDYLAIKSGRTPKSCREMPQYLESMNSAISTGDESLFEILKKASIDTQMLEGRAAENARTAKQQLVVSAGLASDERDAISKLRDFAMNLSSSKVTKISSSADLHVIQAVNSLDEIDKVANALSSRIKEWYGLHFPELENLIDSIEGYARIVLAGRRADMDASVFEGAGFPSEKTEMLMVAASNSRGGDITDQSLGMVKSMSEQLIEFYNLRNNLEDLIEKEMNAVAPNLSAILGTALSARMLARVGSIKKMASLPASTIQVLGAERALFRSLKTGSEPPKHGLLFQHPMVHAAPRWQRGKIARAIAAKAVIAARVDVYSEVPGLNSTLLEKMNIRIGEIGEKFPEPTEPNRQHSQGRYERRYPERGKSQGRAEQGRKRGGRPEWARKRAVESESAQYKNPGKRQERYRYDKHNDDNRNNNDNDNRHDRNYEDNNRGYGNNDYGRSDRHDRNYEDNNRGYGNNDYGRSDRHDRNYEDNNRGYGNNDYGRSDRHDRNYEDNNRGYGNNDYGRSDRHDGGKYTGKKSHKNGQDKDRFNAYGKKTGKSKKIKSKQVGKSKKKKNRKQRR